MWLFSLSTAQAKNIQISWKFSHLILLLLVLLLVFFFFFLIESKHYGKSSAQMLNVLSIFHFQSWMNTVFG